MTVQMKDKFYLNGKRYMLFDVSDNQLLSCKNCTGEAFGTYCTACYSDSIASYEVVHGILTLRENAADVIDNPPVICERDFFKNRKSPRCEPGTKIPFTGYIIIGKVYDRVRIYDFFSYIFRLDEAIELEFQQGILVGQTDLSDFLDYGVECSENNEKETQDGNICIDFDNTESMIDIIRSQCGVAPSGHYGHSIYTWRFGGDGECALCKSLERND